MKNSSYEESFDETCEDDNAIPDEQNVVLQYESYRTPQYEIHERTVDTTVQYEIDPVSQYETDHIPQYETDPIAVACIATESEPLAETTTPQKEVYTVSAPPPVPRRTLLPADSNKTPKVTPKQETSEPVSQYVTPTATVATTPQHETETGEEHQNISYRDIELFSPEDSAPKAESHAERWSDSTSVSLPQIEDVETVSSDPGNAQCEPISEMYFTASSEISLLSDTDQDKVHNDDEDKERDDRKNVIAGHVAAMRERFENMTRANTPCPDLVRSLSPSLEVFRNMTPSPDRME